MVQTPWAYPWEGGCVETGALRLLERSEGVVKPLTPLFLDADLGETAGTAPLTPKPARRT